jgi:C4-type Zn-finger protein
MTVEMKIRCPICKTFLEPSSTVNKIAHPLCIEYSTFVLETRLKKIDSQSSLLRRKLDDLYYMEIHSEEDLP